jgi:ribokinase
MKIYNLGSLNIDYVYTVAHFTRAGETLAARNMQIFPGGKGLNQSIALARAGGSVIHGAVVGDNGEFLLEVMADSHVDVSRIQKASGSCGHAIIQVDGAGQNSILLYPGTNHMVDRAYAEGFLADACPGDVLLLQNEISGLVDIFALAARKGMRIALNPSPYHESLKRLPLETVSWWFCNEIEAEALFGSEDPVLIAENFRQKYPRSQLILTLGSRGSMFIDSENCIHQPIYPVTVADTTAAGDTFMGYYMAAVAAGECPRDALDRASKAASIAVSRPGASDSIPWADEL